MEPREAHFKLKSNGLVEVLSATQEAGDEQVWVELSPDTLYVAYTGTTSAAIEVTSNSSWMLAASDWISNVPTQAMQGNATVYLIVDQNSSEEPRIGFVSASHNGQVMDEIVVVQEGKPDLLETDITEMDVRHLVKASYFLPTALAEKYYEIKNRKASADVIALRYTTIPDSTVVVTDADNKAFYEENKYRYETDERRDIEYVVFDIKPSLEDRQEALKYVEDMRNDFLATDNVINFVNANSDQRYDSTWVGKNDVSESVQKAVFENGNGVGYVYGPYESEGAFNLVRIVDMQNRPDSLMASHILIPFKGAYGWMDRRNDDHQS